MLLLQRLKSLLDKLPLNELKTIIGIVATAMTILAYASGNIDLNTADNLIAATLTLTGVGIGHKILKAFI